MIRILKLSNHDEVSRLESLIEETISGEWDKEEIVDSMPLIEDYVKELSFIADPEVLTSEIDNIDEFVANPPMNLRKLYHVGWTLLEQSTIDTYSDDFERINHAIEDTLERNGATFNS